MWTKKSRTCKATSPKLRNFFAPAPRARRLLCASALLLLASCAGSRPQATGPLPVEELLKPAEARTEMSGTAILTHTKDGRSVSVPAVVLVSWPDKLRFELQDPVGATLFLLVIDGNRFWLYEKNRKENLTGPVQALKNQAKIPFNAQNLVRVFLARPEWEAYRGQSANEAHEFRRKVKFGDEVLSYDPGELTPLTWRLENFDGSAAEARYEEFSSRAGVRYPTRLRLTQSPGNQSYLVVWKDWQNDVPTGKKLFQIPPERDFNRPTKALR